LHFSLHSKGIVDEQIARFAGNFARNFMIFGQMRQKMKVNGKTFNASLNLTAPEF